MTMRIYPSRFAFSPRGQAELGLEIESGALFVYPTDTVYGLGCNALERWAVRALRKLKKQFDRPLSVIVPSKAWIEANCELGARHRRWLAKLPGRYTLVLRLKEKRAVAKEVTLGRASLGLRIPDHPIASFVEVLGFPIVSTSANPSGSPPITKLDELPTTWQHRLDFAIDGGVLGQKPSKVIDLTGARAKVLRDDARRI